MSTIAKIEDSMLAALRAALPGVEVDTLPGPPEEAVRRTLRTPTVWVVYGGGRFSADRALSGYVMQELRQTFYVLVVSKNLRGAKEGARGAYEIVEAVRGALAGLCTPGGRVEIEAEGLQAAEGGLFVYTTTVSVVGSFRKKL